MGRPGEGSTRDVGWGANPRHAPCHHAKEGKLFWGGNGSLERVGHAVGPPPTHQSISAQAWAQGTRLNVRGPNFLLISHGK